MTYPMQGYPDFVRRQAQADEALVDVTGVVTAANDHYGPFYVGNVGAILVRLVAHTANVQAQLNFTTDQALLKFVNQHTIICRDGAPFSRAVAPMGPWLDIPVASLVAGAATYDLRVSVVRQPLAAMVDGTKTTIMSRKGQPVAAGASATEFASATVLGRAELVIACTAATWDVDVSSQNLDASGLNMATLTQAEGGRQFRTLYVPPRTLRVIVHNSSGAPATYDAYIMSDPGPT